jgi:AraC-like DNA-binding protein
VAVDRLDALLQRFTVSARMFHAGALCGINAFEPTEGLGQLHLIRRGPVQVSHARTRKLSIDEPSLLFYPRPLGHRFVTDERKGADMACANVEFHAGAVNPLAQALPAVVVMPLAELAGATPVLELLFREAFGGQCGRQAVVDRLFEVVLIVILRTVMNRGLVDRGLLAGMAHPRLAKALVALHEAPAKAWTLPRLARIAGMSRSAFAASFKETLDSTPGEYLLRWRLGLAQDLLRRGRSLKSIATDVGYASTAALSRAFKTGSGVGAREWKAKYA